MEVRSAIQQIALEHRRRYGYRRITAVCFTRSCWPEISRKMRRYAGLSGKSFSHLIQSAVLSKSAFQAFSPRLSQSWRRRNAGTIASEAPDRLWTFEAGGTRSRSPLGWVPEWSVSEVSWCVAFHRSKRWGSTIGPRSFFAVEVRVRSLGLWDGGSFLRAFVVQICPCLLDCVACVILWVRFVC
jgi:hypothetical protein